VTHLRACQEKKPLSCRKNAPIFSIGPNACTSTISSPSTRSAPVSSVSLDLGQLAYARPGADADPHQSPIRIKAFVLYAQCLKHGPCPPRLYGPRKSSVPCRVQLDVLQILWFLANPFVAHDIGESGDKNDYRLTSTSVMWVQQIPIKSCGLIPTPLPAHYRTQTD